MPFYQNFDTLWQAYQAGQVHSSIIPPSQIDHARALPEKQFHQNGRLTTFFYEMNFLVKPFDCPETLRCGYCG